MIKFLEKYLPARFGDWLLYNLALPFVPLMIFLAVHFVRESLEWSVLYSNVELLIISTAACAVTLGDLTNFQRKYGGHFILMWINRLLILAFFLTAALYGITSWVVTVRQTTFLFA